MDTVILSWQLMLISLAGWLNRLQQTVIAYIKEEIRILKAQLGGKRPLFNAADWLSSERYRGAKFSPKSPPSLHPTPSWVGIGS